MSTLAAARPMTLALNDAPGHGEAIAATGRVGGRISGSDGRHQGIDIWRAAALLRVVTYHALGWAWLTIVFPAVGLMFAIAGSFMARSLDRAGPASVRSRLRRLLPPLWAFGTAALAVMFTLGWRIRPAGPLGWGELGWWILPVRTPPAGGVPWAWAFTAMMWYLVTYLWLVMLSVPLLAAFRRWPWPVLALSLALPVALGLHLFTIGGYLVEPLTNVASYACCWLLGFAHHDGLLRRVPSRVYAVAVGTLMVGTGSWIAWYGSVHGTFDLNDIPVAESLWPVVFVAVVLRCELPASGLVRLRWLQRAVTYINSRAVTIYLWHFSMLVLAQHLFGPVDRTRQWGKAALMWLTVLALTAAVTSAVGWVEDLAARRRPRLLPGVPARRRIPGAGQPGFRQSMPGVIMTFCRIPM